MEVYLDHSATTRCCREAADLMVRIMTEDYGNPSSMHRKGMEAENYLREAASELAGILKVQEKEIYFTSGGTESNNWALVGTAMANRRRGNRILVSAVEHAAVSAPARWLADQGFDVVVLPVDRFGVVKMEALEEALTPETILVSVMHVNNEIGSVEPVEEIGNLIRKKAPEAYFHVDAIQAFGKYRIYPRRMRIDMLSASGHKIHGPKGIGLFYVNEKVKIHPLILGGGQQNGMRSGTDNVPGAAGMALAAKMAYEHLEEKTARMRAMRDRLADGLSRIEQVVFHGMPSGQGAPHILNASFLGIRSEVLLHALEDKGIYVSAGSACSSHKRAGSAVLTAIGCSREEMESAVRFSLGEETREEEIDYTLDVLKALVPVLRRYIRH
ncbi:MAG TPA: cysteine desulfurase [Candidatus Scatomonas merdigallinarum]|nr:cysteine desulfurase [Candidatus Scatomonas merdigallinarum]